MLIAWTVKLESNLFRMLTVVQKCLLCDLREQFPPTLIVQNISDDLCQEALCQSPNKNQHLYFVCLCQEVLIRYKRCIEFFSVFSYFLKSKIFMARLEWEVNRYDRDRIDSSEALVTQFFWLRKIIHIKICILEPSGPLRKHDFSVLELQTFGRSNHKDVSVW